MAICFFLVLLIPLLPSRIFLLTLSCHTIYSILDFRQRNNRKCRVTKLSWGLAKMGALRGG